jgi:hypothetical protein
MKNHAAQESGNALIVAMLLMLVLTITLIGFYFVSSGEQKVAASNRDNEVTYYWAVAGLEQMSNLMADYFSHTASPTPTQLTSWLTNTSNYQSYPLVPPSYIPNLVTYTYNLYCTAPCIPAPCTPVMVPCSTVGNSLGNSYGTIGGNGPLAGLEGVITPFMLQVIADGPNNTEVKLNRIVQEVAVPIFEFGIFSDSDLSFFAGPNFAFGGRVHTNGNLFLAEDSGNTLLLDDHVTAAKDVIRAQLSNGYVIQAGGSYSSTVDVLNGPNGCPPPPPVPAQDACRALALTEGSVVGGPGSAVNPKWQALSLTTYNGYIQNGKTGAKVLNLAIALPGINSQPIAMLQRPPAGESTTSPLGMARFFNLASLRILLSDSQNDIMSLPGVDTSEYPYPLAEAGSAVPPNMPYTVTRSSTIPATYCPKNSNCTLPLATACTPVLAESAGDNNNMLALNTTTLGGYIKIEMNQQSSPGTWKDVTEEILAQGISRDEVTGMAPPSLSLSSNGSLSKTTYYYQITALGAWGESQGTAANVASIATTFNNKTVTVSWTAVAGATGYNVYRTTTSPQTYNSSPNGYITLTIGSGHGQCASPCTSYTDSGATALTQSASGPPAPSCTNTSIIHLEEAAPGVVLATLNDAQTPANFVPINMYDAREGEVRDVQNTMNPPTSSLNGIMNLMEIDVGNLQQWFAGFIAVSGVYAYNGPDALNNGGYILYTSDRRMNCMDGKYELEGTCTANAVSSATNLPTAGESGEFGNEDIINPSVTNGAPNGVLDTCTAGVTACPPEDLDGDGVFRTYGAYAHPIANPTGVNQTQTSPTGTWSAILSSVASTTNNPAFVRITAAQAQENSVVIFRRALRLVNGTLGNLPPLAAAHPSTGAACSGGTGGGFTVASENPVYVLGDYNASVAHTFNDAFPLCHVPASVEADAVTLLSNNWAPGAQSNAFTSGQAFTSGDANSFANPDTPNCNNQRCATTTYYRVAFMGGKGLSFPQPAWGANDSGTDGGTHNFLRYVEDWGNNNVSLNYLGSMASFYTSRQDTGIYKCCTTVYNPPTRNYTFDTDFQNINKLPPGVPRFTDVNALSYYQSVLPSQ